MTHSLHRRGDRESLKDDFVVLGCPSTGINKKGSAPKTREYLRIAYTHHPINEGDMKTGNIYNTTIEDILDRVTDGTIVQVTYDCRENVVALLKELKEKRPGISITVSGVTDIVQGMMDEAGLGRIHTVEYSMGTWGQTEKLPDFDVLMITTMCGHAMIANDLVGKLIRDIKRGRWTLDEVAVEMAKCCTCGNLNLTRAKKILKEMLPLYVINSY
ncbi:MAG: hypothetical protein QME83_19220 [Thermodesulfobacteriota bacterium]|nr:hypothetical protein [Thermodesulfobacteriota bacterium]